MDLGTAVGCWVGGAAPAVEKIAVGSSGLKEDGGRQGKKTLTLNVSIKSNYQMISYKC